ncbi:hypothetical protein ACJJTC_010371 [Scirpophaga incertulas]
MDSGTRTSGSLESNTCTLGTKEEFVTSSSQESNTCTTLNSSGGDGELEADDFGDAMVDKSTLRSSKRISLEHKVLSTREQRNIIKNKFYTKFGIPGHFYSLNVQIICDSECIILNVNAKYGGATHDAFIWENSQANTYIQDLNRNNEQVWFLGDSGYSQMPWMMTPITDAVEGTPEAKYTTTHGKARVVVENTFGRLKNRWRCLKEAFSEQGFGDDLIRGRALRNMLVDRINRLHN